MKKLKSVLMMISILMAMSMALLGCSQREVETVQEKPQQPVSVEEEAPTPTDAEEIEELVMKFSDAYFKGDTAALQEYLVVPYEMNIEVYPNTDKAQEVVIMGISGLEEVQEKDLEEVSVVYLQFKEAADSDTTVNLTIELIKKQEGWKIQFYGLEG